MIDTALNFVVHELNSFLRARLGSTDSVAVLSGLSAMDGAALPVFEGKLVVTLVNIGQETAAPAPGIPVRTSGGGYAGAPAPLHLNLYVMMSASFDHYAEGLKVLSYVLGYFQARPAFDAQSGPGFPTGLDKLSCELVNLSTQELHNVWAVLGARYRPSALYKLRMVTRQQDGPGTVTPAIG